MVDPFAELTVFDPLAAEAAQTVTSERSPTPMPLGHNALVHPFDISPPVSLTDDECCEDEYDADQTNGVAPVIVSRRPPSQISMMSGLRKRNLCSNSVQMRTSSTSATTFCDQSSGRPNRRMKRAGKRPESVRRLRTDRRRVLRVSVRKLRFIDDPELFLRRSVLINNTMRRIQLDIRLERQASDISAAPSQPSNRTGEAFETHNSVTCTSQVVGEMQKVAPVNVDPPAETSCHRHLIKSLMEDSGLGDELIDETAQFSAPTTDHPGHHGHRPAVDAITSNAKNAFGPTLVSSKCQMLHRDSTVQQIQQSQQQALMSTS